MRARPRHLFYKFEAAVPIVRGKWQQQARRKEFKAEKSMERSNKIREIVRLQQILKKWRKIANTSKSSNISNNNGGGGSSKSIKFLKRTLSLSEKDNSAVREVRKGYLAVSVGEEQKRFIIPTEYLSHPAFHILLREAEEEFGFQQAGILRIPCQVSVFESILKMVEEKKDYSNSILMMQLDCASETQRATPTHHPQSPMCR
ncbi:Auxin responsive SAUR protein [Corchorus capsularis]|uniref:Auxin responsive SAUR protein n=1 Tax=Corchorus capsularis TaxID=210143 RepID=A0A1R3GV19_COCAP|nr:Auxin responsive SAUR protein [Corchorus capsularis]